MLFFRIHAVWGVLYACFILCISAQLSMFHAERRSRNTIIIINCSIITAIKKGIQLVPFHAMRFLFISVFLLIDLLFFYLSYECLSIYPSVCLPVRRLHDQGCQCNNMSVSFTSYLRLKCLGVARVVKGCSSSINFHLVHVVSLRNGLLPPCARGIFM